MYDNQSDAILFDGTLPYADALTAERATFDTLELALWPGDYALMAPMNGQYFLQLVDTLGRFAAVSPATFTTWDTLIAFWEETQAKVRAAHTGGKFALARRKRGKLPCEGCADPLDCWNELSAFGAVGGLNCQTIVADILSARDAYCSEYNKLYRALYECNKHLLDEAIRNCDELTSQVGVQHQACQALSDQLAAIQQLISFIDHNGAFLPPEGFPCTTLLHEACCLSLEDYEFNVSVPSLPAIQKDYENAIEAIERTLAPMWRPATKYSIHLQVTDTVDGASTPDEHFYFGFRTAGPLGYFDTDPKASYVVAPKSRDQYMLTGLKGYIDYRRSFPDPSGQLIGTKPLFYEDARILLFFTKRYVYHFFGDWPAYNGLPALTGNAMQIIIIDPAEDISFPNPPLTATTVVPQAVTSWPADDEPWPTRDDPRIPEDIRTLLNLRNPKLVNPKFVEGQCWESGGDMITPARVYTKVAPQYLKPLKLYTIVVNNVYQGQIQEVHSFVCQTSRYPDFAAQVNSYHLDDGKGNQREAIFRIDVPLSAADVSLMLDVVSGNMSGPNAALAGTLADPFDRLVEGVMKLTPLDAAVSTEFNIVRNSTTNAVVAVWIRSPESIVDPRLPDDVLPRSLRVMNGLNSDLNYAVLYSKDRSQAFVMHPSKVIPVTQMNLLHRVERQRLRGAQGGHFRCHTYEHLRLITPQTWYSLWTRESTIRRSFSPPPNSKCSPPIYLKSVGSTGADGSAYGAHLRWLMLRNLGETHLAKGDYATTTLNFNRPDDYVTLLRSRYITRFPIIVDFSLAPNVVNDALAFWIYTDTSTSTVVYIHFRDAAKYASVRAGTDPSLQPLQFVQQYCPGLIEAEVKDKLFFATEFDVARDPATVLRAEALSVEENIPLSPLFVSCRKQFTDANWCPPDAGPQPRLGMIGPPAGIVPACCGGPNLLSNGGFENDVAAFGYETDYLLQGGAQAGAINVTTNASLVNGQWVGLPHTGIAFLTIDGSVQEGKGSGAVSARSGAPNRLLFHGLVSHPLHGGCFDSAPVSVPFRGRGGCHGAIVPENDSWSGGRVGGGDVYLEFGRRSGRYRRNHLVVRQAYRQRLWH